MRPMIWTHHVSLSSSSDPFPCGSKIGCMANGRKTSGEVCTLAAPVKLGGLTPTISMGSRFNRIVLPTTDDRPKARAHNPSLMTATARVPPTLSSSGWIGRPSAGVTPSWR